MLKRLSYLLMKIYLIIWLLVPIYLNSETTNILDIAKNSKTIEEFLENLPNSMKKKWTALFSSESKQSRKNASFEKPRIIANDGKENVIAFDAESNEIEWIYFDQEKGEYLFRSIQFDGKKNAQIVDNSSECMKCHGDPLRPLWESYPHWPGAYGGVDDRIHVDSKEAKEYTQFIKKASTHERYGKLDFSKKKFEKSKERPYLKSEKKSYELLDLPNAQLSFFFVKTQRTATAKRLTSKLSQQDYLGLLLAYGICEKNPILDLEEKEYLKSLKHYNKLLVEHEKNLKKHLKNSGHELIDFYYQDFDQEYEERKKDSFMEKVPNNSKFYHFLKKNDVRLSTNDISSSYFDNPVLNSSIVLQKMVSEYLKVYNPNALKKWQSYFKVKKPNQYNYFGDFYTVTHDVGIEGICEFLFKEAESLLKNKKKNQAQAPLLPVIKEH